MEPSERHISSTDDLQKANDLNDFYLRFQTLDLSNSCKIVLDSLKDDPSIRPELDSFKVLSLFSISFALRNPVDRMGFLPAS